MAILAFERKDMLYLYNVCEMKKWYISNYS